MPSIKEFIEKQMAIAVKASVRTSTAIREHQDLMLKLRSITALEEKELVSKMKETGIGANSLYHFYAYFGRFPSKDECVAVKEIGIYEFVKACGM